MFHLIYRFLLKDLILLGWFDPDADLATKQAMQKALQDLEEEEPLLQASVDMTNIKDKTFRDFVTKNRWKLFRILGVPDTFVKMDPESWNKSGHFKIAHDGIFFLVTTNDYAEKSGAFKQQMTLASCFKDEKQLQYALQIVKQSRVSIPNIKKSTQLQQSLYTRLSCCLKNFVYLYFANFEAFAP